MDRYFAALISDYKLNRREAETNPDYVPKILRPTNLKLTIWLIVTTTLLSLAIAGF